MKQAYAVNIVKNAKIENKTIKKSLFSIDHLFGYMTLEIIKDQYHLQIVAFYGDGKSSRTKFFYSSVVYDDF